MSQIDSIDDIAAINSLITRLQKITKQFEETDDKKVALLNPEVGEEARITISSHPFLHGIEDISTSKIGEDTYLESIEPLLVQVIEHEIAERASRSKYLPERYFSEPAWDIMLDLYVQRAKGNRVSVTSACIATNAPLSTALRWVNALLDDGLVKRTDSRSDRRRAWLELTEKGAHKIASYAQAVAQKRGVLNFMNSTTSQRSAIFAS